MFVKRLFRTLSVILIALFFTGALPWRELRADANIHGDYTCDRLSVTYDQVSSWDLNTQGEFVITNISEETVDGWTIKFDFASDVTITSLWNGQDLRNETTPANTLIIGNEVYNGTINPGESVSFGLIMTGTEFAPVSPLDAESLIEEPVQEEVMVEPETVVEEQTVADPSTCVIFAGSDITISGYRTTIHGDIYSGSDFNYQGSELSVDGIVRAESNVNVSGYSSVITGTEENALHVDMPDLSEDILTRENCSYSEEGIDISAQTIEGETVIVSEGDITINVDTISEDSNVTLYSVNGNITVNGNQAILNGTIYAPNGRVTINANEIALAGKILANEFIFNGSVLTVTNDPEEIPEITPEPTVTVEPTVVPTATVTPTDIPTATPTVTVTPTDVSTATPTETVTPTPVEEEEEPTPTPTPEPVDETLDSDTDGIPDYLEIEIGTNPNDPDSDGDGLEDYLELMVGYDPTSQDTDNNGVLDGEEDLDNDGLCNINELNLDTDIFSEDSDCDGLKDGEEVYTYGTDPKDPDSDDDGILDGDEIELGKDPTDPSDATLRIEQTKIQEITNEEDPAITSVEVTMSLADSIDRSLKIRDMYNVDVRTTNVPGRIGSPLSFECEEDFDTATVVIHYSEAALGDTAESDLGILWYDEENGIFVEQTQAILDSSNNKITVELEHFSEYVLVDIAQWENNLPTAYVAEDIEGYSVGRNEFDVYFSLDITNAVSDADKIALIGYMQEIISLLQDGDRCHFMIFDRNINRSFYYWEFNATVNGLPQEVRRQMFDLQGNNYTDLSAADLNVGHDLLYLSLSAGPYSPMQTVQHGSLVYTIYGQSYGYSLDIRQDNTGSMNAIRNLLGSVSSSVVDEDNDGIPDFLEEEGMYGIDGITYYSDTDPDTGYDSDDDDLSDGEEMGTMYTIYRVDSSKVKINGRQYNIQSLSGTQYSRLSRFIPSNIGELVYVFDAISDPSDPDSDGDGHWDHDVKETRPMVNDITTIDLGGAPYTVTERDSGYIHVSGVPEDLWEATVPDPNSLFYGGDQNWFEDAVFGDNGVNLFIESTGCGLIATHDIRYYLEHGASTLSWDTYRNSVIGVNDEFVLIPTSNLPVALIAPVLTLFRINNSYSIDPSYIQSYFVNHGYTSHYVTSDQVVFSDTLEVIENSLRDDHPIILVMHANDNAHAAIMHEVNYASGQLDLDSLLMRGRTVNKHYVTITGIYKDGEEVYLRCQSWGAPYYVEYNAFCSNCASGEEHGGLLFIE